MDNAQINDFGRKIYSMFSILKAIYYSYVSLLLASVKLFLGLFCKRGYLDTSNLPKAEQSRLSFCRKTGPNLRLGASSNAEVQTPISKIA